MKMRLKDKYISKREKDNNPASEKTVLSDDAYAVSEFIEILTDKIEQTRACLS